MGSARIWNKISPGVATAWRVPTRISRNGCNSAGRGSPNSRSHAADPNAMTQDRFSSASRKPTARMSAARSAHSDLTAAQLSAPGLMVTTRKIAVRVSGALTGCGIGLELPAAPGVLIGSDSIRWCPGKARQIPCSPRGRQPQERVDRACDAQPVVTTRRSPRLMKTERTDDAAL